MRHYVNSGKTNINKNAGVPKEKIVKSKDKTTGNKVFLADFGVAYMHPLNLLFFSLWTIGCRFHCSWSNILILLQCEPVSFVWFSKVGAPNCCCYKSSKSCCSLLRSFLLVLSVRSC